MYELTYPLIISTLLLVAQHGLTSPLVKDRFQPFIHNLYTQADSSPLKQAASDTLLNVSGILENGDQRLPDNSLYDLHTFSGRAGESVTLLLDSPDFDTYLILLQPNGEKLSENDDLSSNNPNSSISGVLPVDGVYMVIVNAFDANGQGAYLLRVMTAGANDVEGDSTNIDSLIRQGTQRLRIGQNAEAQEFYLQALQLAQAQGDRPQEAALFEYLGVATLGRGDVSGGIDLLERSLEMQHQLGNRSNEMRVLQNLGNAYEHHVRNFTMARDYYQKALAIARELGDGPIEQQLLNRLRGF